jgi:para-nitrobenzyl esterase
LAGDLGGRRRAAIPPAPRVIDAALSPGKYHSTMKVSVVHAALAGFLVANALSIPAFASDPLRVVTDHGAVQGVAGPGVREFKGIPFALPPVGPRRFAPPEYAARWKGILDASNYRSACPQLARFGVTDASDDEDCLYLNVTVPTAAPQDAKKHPVLVWIHGGAYVGGSSNLYPLDTLSRTGDLVVVSINYRLGALGFMAHPGFPAAHNGSVGLEDQRMALRWVKANIAAFGGDPKNVTLAGESAGAASVCMQLMSTKESRGLFEKAIIQSIACPVGLATVADASKTGELVAKLVHCDDPATAVACLRATPIQELLAAQTEAATKDARAFTPSVGSISVPEQGATAFASGRFLRVPILNGGNRDELRLYVAYAIAAGQSVTNDNYSALLTGMYGANGADVLAQYPAANYSSAPSALGTVQSDFLPGNPLSNCLYLEMAGLASRYVPLYQYEFTDRHAPPVVDDPGFELGAVHAAELPYFFPHISHNSKINGPDLEPPSRQLAATMVAYWSRFAHTGHPDPAGLPAWPRYRQATDVMQFEPGAVHLFDAAASHHCGFWQGRYPALLTAAVAK